MKFQLLELNLPPPDKIAKSLAETIRINRNRLMKWVMSSHAQGRKLQKSGDHWNRLNSQSVIVRYKKESKRKL